MKKRILSLLFLLFMALQHQNFYAKSSEKKTTPSKVNTLNKMQTNVTPPEIDPIKLESDQENAARLLFSKIEPTNSIYEEKIELVYGPSGLNISEEDLAQIKKAYCYLEFLVKIEKIKNNPTYAQYQKSFQHFITTEDDNQQLFPTVDLVNSNDWKSVIITEQDLIDSTTWQNSLQAIICDGIDNTLSTMVDVIQVQNQISTFLQNIEMAYSTQDYTQLRLYLESIELQILLQTKQRQYYINQSHDLKNLTQPKLEQAILKFKKTDFYISSHTPQANQQQNKQVNQPKKANASSQTQKQIIFYFMLIDVQSKLYNMLTTKNLQTTLSMIDSQKILLKMFSYNSTDFIYLNDFLIVKELIESNKKSPILTTISMTPTYNEENQTTINTAKNDVLIQSSTDTTTTEDTNTQLTAEQINKNLIEKIFIENFPTDSIYEKTIDTIYGPSGLNINQKIIKKIKNTYCYLEFLVKLEKVSNNKNLIQYKSDFNPFIDASSNDILVIPTQDLIKSNGWQSIKINEQDILESAAWQAFLKLMICDSLDSSTQFMTDIAQVNLQMTGYLASIEAAYSDEEFTQMRLYSESIQLYELLQSDQKNRYREQCKDWKALNKNQLQQAIDTFKKKELYQSIYNNNSQLNQKNNFTSQTKELTCSYFMLINIQNDVYEAMALTNLESMLNQTNLDALSPNFFTYQIQDFIYLSDYVTVAEMIERNKQDLQATLSAPENSEDNNDAENNVIIQATKNPFAKTNKKTAQSFNKINKGIKILKDSNLDSKITNTAKTVGDKTRQKITKTTRNINNGIGKMGEDLATGFIKMSGGLTYGFVMIGGSKKAAEKARDETIKKMNAHKGILAKALAVVVIVSMLLIIGNPLILVPVMMFVAGQITSSMLVDKRVREPVMKGMMTVMMPVMLGMEKMTDAFTEGFIEMSAGLTYAGCMIAVGLDPNTHINPKLEANKVRAKLNKYRGTINIIMSVVITILITVVIIVCSAGIGAAYTAAIDAGFFGSQAAAASATTAASLATTTATTTSATAVTATATETSAIAAATTARAAAQQAATTAANTALSGSAKQAAATAAQKAAQAAATAAARQAAATSARQAAELAAKQAAEVAAQATAKAAARQAAVSATKQLAIKQAQEVAAKQALQATIKQGGNVAAKQVLVEQATLARTAAQQAAKQTSDNALKQSAELTAKQASYKITQANAQKALTNKGFKQAAELAAKQSGTQTAAGTSSQTSSSMVTTETLETTLTNSQQIADKAAMNLTKKEVARQFAKNSMDEAAQTLKSAQASLAKDPDNVFAQAAVKAAQKNIATTTTKDTLAASELTQAATTNSVKQAELTGIKAVANNSAFKDSYIASSEFTTKRAAYQAGEMTDKEMMNAARQIQNVRQAELGGMSAYKAAKTSQMSGDTIAQSIAAGTRQELLSWSFVIGQALNAGFGVFSALGAVNQDEIAAMQAEQEKKSIKTLWKFVENNKIAITQEQTHFADELHKKHLVAVENQAFNLQYYKNFLNGSVNLVQQQIAQVLAQQQIDLLTPDENGLRAADIGSSWGLQTKFVYLYPSQGFISTTLGRPDFPYAQEVAQTPLAVQETQKQENTDLANQQIQDTKLWFNQRAVAIAQTDPTKPLEVEIKFKVIYNLNTAYHVGLYLGGNYHDYNSPEYLKSLQDTGVIDTNEAHLAKMFVIKREDVTKNPSLGVYENEGKGWIIDQPLEEATIHTTAVYHMRANLDNNKLTINFWQENNPSKIITKIIEVTPCDQRTFGVIFSGIAIEWGVIEPNLPITENNQARPTLNRPTEIEREKTAKNQRILYGFSTVDERTNESSIKLINPNSQIQTISTLQDQAAGTATVQIIMDDNGSTQNSNNSIIIDNLPNLIQTVQQSQNIQQSDLSSINQTPSIKVNSIPDNSIDAAMQDISDQFILAGNAGFSL